VGRRTVPFGPNAPARGSDPFHSCFLLGLSVGTFLTAMFEGRWGLSVGGAPPVLTVAPTFPPEWGESSLERLRVGESWVDLRWAPGNVRATLRREPTLTLRNRAGEATVIAPGGESTLALP